MLLAAMTFAALFEARNSLSDTLDGCYDDNAIMTDRACHAMFVDVLYIELELQKRMGISMRAIDSLLFMDKASFAKSYTVNDLKDFCKYSNNFFKVCRLWA